MVDEIRRSGTLPLAGRDSPRQIPFTVDDIILHPRKRLPFHSNTTGSTRRRPTARSWRPATTTTTTTNYYLVGGGFVLSEDDAGQPKLVPRYLGRLEGVLNR